MKTALSLAVVVLVVAAGGVYGADPARLAVVFLDAVYSRGGLTPDGG